MASRVVEAKAMEMVKQIHIQERVGGGNSGAISRLEAVYQR